MFVPSGALQKDALRQGDILQDVHLLGALNYGDINIPTPLSGGGVPKTWLVNQQLQTGFAMILSHCCEIAIANGVKLTGIILAPLRDVNKATEPARVRELKESNFIDRDNPNGSYLKYWYVEPHAALKYDGGAVADFSKCFSVRKTSFDLLLAKKVIQLNDEARFNMSLKLALYFHRKQDAA